MKTSSDHLFKLIKSLSGPEKGYFKKYVNLHKRNDQNNYVKLFDAINLQEEYNESVLFRQFKHELFINNFSIAKNYLYDVILQSLEAFNKNSNTEIRGLLNKIEILTGKGLYEQSKKLLKKAKELATECEKLTYIPEINLLEQSISHLTYDTEYMEKNQGDRIDEIKACAAKLINIAEYYSLNYKIILQEIKTGTIRNLKEHESYDWFLKNTLLKNDKQALSINAEILYYESFMRYYYAIGDLQKGYEVSSRLIKVLEENPKVIENHPNYTTKGYYMMAFQCYRVGKYKKALEYVSRMEDLKPKTTLLKNDTFLKAHIIKSNIYFSTGNIKKCIALISEVDFLLEKKFEVGKTLKQVVFRFSAYVLMIAGEYKLALKWLVRGNIFLDHDMYSDIECIVRIIEIVLHYELGKFDIMESRIKSTYRFLMVKQKLYEIEKISLKFLKKLSYVNSEEKTIQFFKQLKKVLNKLIEDPLEQRFLDYFDIISWLESKIENKTFEEVIKSKPKSRRGWIG